MATQFPWEQSSRPVARRLWTRMGGGSDAAPLPAGGRRPNQPRHGLGYDAAPAATQAPRPPPQTLAEAEHAFAAARLRLWIALARLAQAPTTDMDAAETIYRACGQQRFVK